MNTFWFRRIGVVPLRGRPWARVVGACMFSVLLPPALFSQPHRANAELGFAVGQLTREQESHEVKAMAVQATGGIRLCFHCEKSLAFTATPTVFLLFNRMGGASEIKAGNQADGAFGLGFSGGLVFAQRIGLSAGMRYNFVDATDRTTSLPDGSRVADNRWGSNSARTIEVELRCPAGLPGSLSVGMVDGSGNYSQQEIRDTTTSIPGVKQSSRFIYVGARIRAFRSQCKRATK